MKQFAKSGRFGIYCRVLKEGSVGVGDSVKKIVENSYKLSIGAVGRLLLEQVRDPDLLERASELDALPENVRAHFQFLVNRS